MYLISHSTTKVDSFRTQISRSFDHFHDPVKYISKAFVLQYHIRSVFNQVPSNYNSILYLPKSINLNNLQAPGQPVKTSDQTGDHLFVENVEEIFFKK